MQRRPISATIFGILNLGFGAISWLELLFFQPMADITKTAGGHSPLKAFAADPSQAHWLWITGLLDALASLVLMAGGAGLLAGKNWGRTASIAWGGFDILFSLARIPVNFKSAQAAVVGLNAPAAMVGPLTVGATVFGTALGLVYPILLLYFMTRPKMKAAFAGPPPLDLA